MCSAEERRCMHVMRPPLLHRGKLEVCAVGALTALLPRLSSRHSMSSLIRTVLGSSPCAPGLFGTVAREQPQLVGNPVKCCLLVKGGFHMHAWACPSLGGLHNQTVASPEFPEL